MAEPEKSPVPPLLAKVVMVVAYLQPLMTLPQIYLIWIKHQPASLLTWSAYFIASLVWFAYGWKIKDKPLITTFALWIIFEGAVVLGLLVQALH